MARNVLNAESDLMVSAERLLFRTLGQKSEDDFAPADTQFVQHRGKTVGEPF